LISNLQVKKLVKGNECKKLIYQELAVLRRCRDPLQFHTMLDYFVQESLKDQVEFKEYFVRYYYDRQKMWAVCYRDPTFPDTNAHAESFHRVLKHVAFAGKRNRRVSVLIDALLDMEKDLFLMANTYGLQCITATP
jgi:hypothetical protein